MLIDVCFHGSGVWYLFVDKSVVLNAYQTSCFLIELRGRWKSTLASINVSSKQTQ